MRQERTIVLTILGDGSSTEFDLDLSSAPFEMVPTQAGFITQPGFDFRVAQPTEVLSVQASGAPQPTASISKGTLILSWASPPPGPQQGAGPFTVQITLGF